MHTSSYIGDASRSTIRPAPPPKPSHLSVAFTGTLSSEALRNYIRKQSNQTIINGKVPTPSTIRRLMDADSLDSDTYVEAQRQHGQSGYDDDDDDDDEDMPWGTARPSITPTKPVYGKLANLFTQDETPTRQHQSRNDSSSMASHATIKVTSSSSRGGTDTFRTARSPSENTNGHQLSAVLGEDEEDTATIEDCDVSTFRLSKPTSRQHLPPASSVFDVERSREPSLVSNVAFFQDQDENRIVAETGLMHARDGSRFERASPLPTATSRGLSDSQSPPSSSTKPATVAKPEAPSQADRLVAGPSPARPRSIVLVTEPAGGATGSSQTKPAITPEIYEPVPSSQLTMDANPGGRSARALYAFAGEAHFNELNLGAGQVFQILEEDIGGGWSLAVLQADGGHWTKGLVPRGWYAYIQDFTLSPPTVEARKSGEPSALSLDTEGPKTPRGKSPNGGAGLHLMSPSSSSSNSHASHNRNDSCLSPVKNWERARPASGMGEMSGSKLGAIQALHMVKSRSEGPGTKSKEAQDAISPANSSMSLPVSESSRTLASQVSSADDENSTSLILSPATTPESIAPAMQTENAKRKAALLGGRSMNRFSPFVTTGVEDYVLFGSKASHEEKGKDKRNQFEIVTNPQGGPSWKSPGFDIYIEIHTPEVQLDERGREFIAFVVHTSYTFFSERESQDDVSVSEDPLSDPTQRPASPTYMSSVYRRYNHFKWLSSHLHRVYPFFVLSLPPLPSANHAAGKAQRFEPSFVEKRRRELQGWLISVVRHPILRTDEAVRFFLETEHDGEEWAQGAKEINQRAAAASGSDLLSSTFHPLFGVDTQEAAIEAKHVAAFLATYERAIGADGSAPQGGILGACRDMREGGRVSSDNYRHLSYAILRMMTGTALGTATRQQTSASGSSSLLLSAGVFPPMGNVGKRDENGATNEQRAWCWREGCSECKSLTKALQGTVDAFQQVADLYDSHAHGTLRDEHDRLWNLSRAQSQNAPLLDIHKATLAKYREATGEPDPLLVEADSSQATSAENASTDEQMAARCETVLNVTMSEVDRIHRQRVEDWNAVGRSMLDNQIALYEDVLHTLREAQVKFDKDTKKDPAPMGEEDDERAGNDRAPILPSPFEVELHNPVQSAPLSLPSATLLQPSKAVRPMSLAGEVLSDFFGGASAFRGPPAKAPSLGQIAESTNASGHTQQHEPSSSSSSSTMYFTLWR